MLLVGICFFALSSLALLSYDRSQSSEQTAFALTRHFVIGSVYKFTRNPMSLGFYAGCLALGLLSGSTYFTLLFLVAAIPTHIFYLKFYEERELEVRFGRPYLEYKEKVPFLIPNFRLMAGTGWAGKTM